MTRDEVIALALEWAKWPTDHQSQPETVHLARELLAMNEELERLGWSAMKLECKGDELCVEVQSLRDELQSMRAVVEAAEAWRDHAPWTAPEQYASDKLLCDAVDALRAARKEGK